MNKHLHYNTHPKKSYLRTWRKFSILFTHFCRTLTSLARRITLRTFESAKGVTIYTVRCHAMETTAQKKEQHDSPLYLNRQPNYICVLKKAHKPQNKRSSLGPLVGGFQEFLPFGERPKNVVLQWQNPTNYPRAYICHAISSFEVNCPFEIRWFSRIDLVFSRLVIFQTVRTKNCEGETK